MNLVENVVTDVAMKSSSLAEGQAATGNECGRKENKPRCWTRASLAVRTLGAELKVMGLKRRIAVAGMSGPMRMMRPFKQLTRNGTRPPTTWTTTGSGPRARRCAALPGDISRAIGMEVPRTRHIKDHGTRVLSSSIKERDLVAKGKAELQPAASQRRSPSLRPPCMKAAPTWMAWTASPLQAVVIGKGLLNEKPPIIDWRKTLPWTGRVVGGGARGLM
jgi:hypothetical protein